MSAAQEVYEKVNTLIESGTSRADAFKQVAEETGRTPHGVRGSYYSYARSSGNGKPRTRRRITTADDALADARAALERSIASISKEVEAADERARESAAEAKSIKDSADERRKAITERLESLK